MIAGLESGLDTVLVLSGCTAESEIGSYAWCPTYVLNGVGDIAPAE